MCLTHLVEEDELMIHNLLPCLRHKHGDEALLYFTEEAKSEARDDGWDAAQNRVACATDTFLEEDLQDDIGLTDAQSCVEEHEKKMEEKKIGRPSLKLQEAQEEAKATVAAMTNKVVAALYNDDDSIATMEDIIISKQKSSKTPNEVNYTPILSIPLQPIIK